MIKKYRALFFGGILLLVSLFMLSLFGLSFVWGGRWLERTFVLLIGVLCGHLSLRFFRLHLHEKRLEQQRDPRGSLTPVLRQAFGLSRALLPRKRPEKDDMGWSGGRRDVKSGEPHASNPEAHSQ
jgi:hypothetical protein